MWAGLQRDRGMELGIGGSAAPRLEQRHLLLPGGAPSVAIAGRAERGMTVADRLAAAKGRREQRPNTSPERLGRPPPQRGRGRGSRGGGRAVSGATASSFSAFRCVSTVLIALFSLPFVR